MSLVLHVVVVVIMSNLQLERIGQEFRLTLVLDPAFG